MGNLGRVGSHEVTTPTSVLHHQFQYHVQKKDKDNFLLR